MRLFILPLLGTCLLGSLSRAGGNPGPGRGQAQAQAPAPRALLSVATPPRIVSATLRFQDSLGTQVRKVRGDSLPKSMREILASIMNARTVLPSADADTDLNPFRDVCMCDAPADTLEVLFSDSSRQSYEFYCSHVSKAVGRNLIRMDLPHRSAGVATGRWDALRAKFCPKGFGCSDGIPGWDVYTENWTDSGWRISDHPHYDEEELWRKAILEASPREPFVSIAFTLGIEKGRVASLTVDSVPEKYRSLAMRFSRKIVGQRSVGPSGRYRVMAANYYYEE